MDITELERVISMLPLPDKIRLARQLDSETWRSRFKDLLAVVDKRIASHPIAEEEIKDIADKVRRRRYDRSRHRH